MNTDTTDLNCVKDFAWKQQLLETSCLDLKILWELGQYRQATEIFTIKQQLDLVNSILQLNCTSSEFDTARILASRKADSWSFTNRLLKCYRQVVVLESFWTILLTEAYCQIASAYLGTRKTKQIVQARYYWYKMDKDIERFVWNCYTCRRFTVLQDKPPGLLHLLLIADC